MKKNALLLVLCLTIFISAQAQSVEVHNYKFYADYDSHKNRINHDHDFIISTELSVSIMSMPNIYGGQNIVLTGSESKSAGNERYSMPLCPINQWFNYSGIENGWRVFCWGSILVLISSDSNTARIERYVNRQFIGYTEYRK